MHKSELHRASKHSLLTDLSSRPFYLLVPPQSRGGRQQKALYPPGFAGEAEAAAARQAGLRVPQ